MLAKLQKRAVDQSSFDRGDVSFILISSALVLFMVPGLMFLYSGLSRRKNALSVIWVCFFGSLVTTITWYIWGYSLAFSPTATNGFIGNLEFGGHHNALGDPSPGSPLIPTLLYSLFQMEFCCVTVAILMGAIAERGRVMPAMLFVFVWVTLVYAPVACWVWNINGWAFKWGVADYAGGGPVEIGSGVGGLAYSWVIGRRHERELVNFRPHNVTLVTLGTFMLWFGWIGFNAGSAFGANLRAVYAALNTCLCASVGGITWCLLDYRIQKKYTMIGLCSGTIAGLVAATPSSGFIPLWASVALGFVASAICNYGTKIKHLIRIDDALDLFAEHALAGIVGLLFNGLFAKNEIIALDDVNTAINGGWLDRNFKQLYIQFAYVIACCAYVFAITALIAKVFCLIPFLNLRASDHAELIGIDDDQIGEFVQDFVEVRRAYDEWAPAAATSSQPEKPEKFNGTHTPVAAGDRHGFPDTNVNVHTPSNINPNHHDGLTLPMSEK
ncbi:Ammonium transporter MEP3 [Serendipita indica DSM 11827]|uniref:Ammonium transporter n=1 Tax=Serendipita indica (strain DSM 11827) TaxID=1109443 RepID=G4TGJ1_SERID|nr:Ammonium transporter MEP3 [Serendipita indica DSM 11827]CCA70434.1 probable ammonium transporter MEAA [Serendipita indica DSM 11827]